MDSDAADAYSNRYIEVVVGILVILVIIIIAYRMNMMNWMLPAKWRHGCAISTKQTFVGNWSRDDQGKPTLIYASSHARWPMVNLGTYV